MKSKFEIIELEDRLIAKGYGIKEEALKVINRHESKEWGLVKDELTKIEDIKPIFELTTRERYCEDILYSWKDEPVPDENNPTYLYKTPIAWVVYF